MSAPHPDRLDDGSSTVVRKLVWSVHVCPNCKQERGLGLMSLAISCPCGFYYAEPEKRWYDSRETYELQFVPPPEGVNT